MITIGISPDWDTQKGRINIPNDYITAVLRAGGLPLLFPLLDLTFTDKKEQSLAIIIVARLFRSQSRKASVVL